MAKEKERSERQIRVSNRKARHDYTILDSFEAGIVLTGSEVKSLRQGGGSLAGAFATVTMKEAMLVGMNIPAYAQAGYAQHDPKRKRRLLLHAQEIRRLHSKTREQGLTLIPLACYFVRGLAKVELGLAKGKRLYDKREALKAKDAKRDMARLSLSR